MRVLIAYYSRTGVTRAAAGAIASALRLAGVAEVDVEEVVDTKCRKGPLGYLGAGKDASLRRRTVISQPASNPGDYDVLVLGTPVWAFTLAAAMRTYCTEYGKDAAKAALFCTMGGSGDERTFKHAEDILGKVAVAKLSLLERHVKDGDEQGFLAKVRQFAEKIAAS